MCAYCDSERGDGGFCRVSSSCSGPAPSNLACDYPMPEGKRIYRGGVYGGCKFAVDKEVEDGKN